MSERLNTDPDGHGIWLGDRHVPWATIGRWTSLRLPTGETFCDRQALVPFENGLSLSITWGSCTYSDNYNHYIQQHPFEEQPEKVEVGVLGDGDLISGVAPYVKVTELREFMSWVAELPSSTRELPMPFTYTE